MTAFLRELLGIAAVEVLPVPVVPVPVAAPVPPALGTIVPSPLGPGRIAYVWAHLTGGGWTVGLKLITPVKRDGYVHTDIDAVVSEDGGAKV